MFSSLLIGLLVSLSVSAWTYSKFMRTTGNNTQKAVTGAGLIGLLAFIAVLFIMFFINMHLEG